MQNVTINRRRFLQGSAALGTSLVLGFKIPVALAKGEAPRDPDDINAWLEIDQDGMVTIMVPTAELGQGVFTSAPMLIAEELECDWRKVQGRISPTDPIYNNRMFGVQATASSTSARWSFEPLRRIGATAREMLKQAAADTWSVPVAECIAKDSVVTHPASGQSLPYEALIGKASTLPRPDNVTLKDPADWTLLGKKVDRLDIPQKTSGTATFGVDVKVPGMLIGTVVACPMLGGTLESVDHAPALSVSGVHQVVELDNAVVVLGDSYWTAKQGLAQLKPKWKQPKGDLLQTDSLMDTYRKAAAGAKPVAKQRGDAKAAHAASSVQVKADYDVPYLAHATMEPMNATADVRSDSAVLWGATQVAGEMAERVSPFIGVPIDKITFHSTFVGGGFGRREEFDVFIQAALASKAAGRPVKLIWSREEDIQQDTYRPAAAATLTAALDEAGALQAMDVGLSCSSIYIRNFPSRVKDGVDPKSTEGIVDMPYGVPNFLVRYAMVNTHIPVGFWRGVGHTQNCFFFESFLDEVAHQAGADPYEYRLGLLKDQPRHAEVLKRVAKQAGWGKAPQGRVHGIALSEAWGSICAIVVEASVADKKVTIHRVVCGIDSGRFINRATVERQLEGGVVWALTAVFNAEITFKDGKVVQSNFHDYPLPFLADTPLIETILVESGEKIGGVGESSVPPFAPALANAIFAATGERLRSMPFKKQGYSLA